MKRKRINILVLVISLIAVISIIAASVISGYVFESQDKTIAFESGEPPEAASLGLEAPASDFESQRNFSTMLYDKACKNYQNLDSALMLIKSENKMFNVPVYGYRYVHKQGEEFRYLEVSHIPPQEGPAGLLFDALLGSISAESTKFALSKYTDASMKEVYCERVIDPIPEVVLDQETNTNEYIVDWAKAKVEIEEKHIFNKNQEGDYLQTELVITNDTILKAKVKKVDPKPASELEPGEKPLPMGYWELTLELDPAEDKATAIVLPRLRGGAGDKAYYVSLLETIQIWENGYFKYFRAEDTWAGGPANSGATLIFETFFRYDEFSLDINNYQFLPELKDIALKAKADGKVE